MKLSELVYQDESRNNRSCRVGDRDADPYAKCSEPSGKNQQAGNEEQHLPGERKEDRLLRHPDGKEKVCRHHLKPTIGKTAKTICKPYTAASISSGSVVNMRTITDGNN